MSTDALDPEAIMAEHSPMVHLVGPPRCPVCDDLPPCLVQRLAVALAASRDQLAQAEAARDRAAVERDQWRNDARVNFLGEGLYTREDGDDS